MNPKIIPVSFALLLTLFVSYSCKKEFLEQPPLGAYDEASLSNKKGVEGMLVNAYATLDGPEGSWYTSANNWVWGSVLGADANKGSEPTDQVDVNPVERFEVLPSNAIIKSKWDASYDGIGQANQVLKTLPNVTDINDDERKQIGAEARFLRAHHYFELKKVFKNVPFVDENATDFKLPNDSDIWTNIEDDLKFAYDNLAETKPQVGRVNKWAAGCYLAKAYMFQSRFQEAKSLLDVIIASGKTTNNLTYALTAEFQDNFTIEKENNSETVFAIQASYKDGSQTNGNYDGTLNYPHGSGNKPGGCCGFFQPSQSLVNSYKTDAVSGLPFITTFNSADVTNDMLLTSGQPFTPYAGPLDPRLDWTVGRRGIPFLDWGPHPGRDWIRDVIHGGPYSPKKNTFSKANVGTTAGSVGWGWINNSLNYIIVRFADVLLWAAECEVEVGSLEKAREYVNRIRRRAANPVGFVQLSPNVPAANYVIKEYETPWTDKELARQAVRFERKLELGMEGHRFFDLVRWGIADQEINSYLNVESTKILHLAGAKFTKNRNEYMPIPEYSINQSFVNGQATLKQNQGY